MHLEVVPGRPAAQVSASSLCISLVAAAEVEHLIANLGHIQPRLRLTGLQSTV